MATPPKNLQLFANVLGSVLARGVNVIATALTIPMTLHSLGTTEYATFATMASFSIFFAFSDLGIGLSVVNPVASATDAAAIRKARLAISQAWGVQLMIGIAVGLGGSLIAALVQSQSYGREITSSFTLSWIAMLMSVGLGIATGLGQRVMFALGKNFEGNLWLIAGRALSVGAVYLAARHGAGLFVFILASQAVPALVAVVMMVYLFLVRNPDLAPELTAFEWNGARRQLATGLMFMVLNLSVFCEIGVDNIVLSLVRDAQTVTLYDITSKPFFYVCSLSGIILFPVWPYITQEIAAGRAPSRRTVNMAFLFLTAAIALIGGILWLNIGKIIALWVGSQPSSLDSRTTFLMGLNAVFVAIGMLQSMILNARGKIKEQAIVQLVFIAGLVPWKLALAAAAGPFGIVVALATAYVPRLIYVDRKLIKPGLKAGQAGAS